MEKELEKIIEDIQREYKLFHKLREQNPLDVTDEYKKINYVYFRIFGTNYEVLPELIRSGYMTSGIILVRTMLELFVKSYYLEFIAKANKDDVKSYIEDDNQFPNFFQMTQKLEEVRNDRNESFNGTFKQFTKSYLKSYEIYTLFSHGKGELLTAFYESEKMSYTSEQISDVLFTIKGMFASMAMLYFHVQGNDSELQEFISKVKLT
ncbi:hypothetical protein L1D59_18530 [Pseudoalteromonas piscicida]|uniref:hypothetical protein n=1 Tax=Pseudoalteromonas piscicida TaxID=43662 RepID=UPI001EFEC571|nr:hypothetical protein [Pseudoalteromonas piscicida]MCG9770595.1 hypothetical protein [Pseudoalteromonas piscicida]